MSRAAQSRKRPAATPQTIHEPRGVIAPRVQAVGPEHFGIVCVDCAKARSKWMLADFYGKILVEATVVEHNKQGFDAAISQIRRAIKRHSLADVIVAIERTGIYHLPVKRVFSSNGFETRIVHPLTTRQYRLPADPGNKTDDTDLLAIHRATTNGFGLIEPPLDETHGPLRLLARYRRSLVRKNASSRNQIIALVDVALPGYTGLFDIFKNQAALTVARCVTSAAEVKSLGTEGLAQLLESHKVRYQRRTLIKILAWANGVGNTTEYSSMYNTIIVSLDDERCARLQQIAMIE